MKQDKKTVDDKVCKDVDNHLWTNGDKKHMFKALQPLAKTNKNISDLIEVESGQLLTERCKA